LIGDLTSLSAISDIMTMSAAPKQQLYRLACRAQGARQYTGQRRAEVDDIASLCVATERNLAVNQKQLLRWPNYHKLPMAFSTA
jgi:hypothetical protein